MKPRHNMKLLKGTLRSLLLTINGLEGLEREYMVEAVREQLYNYKNFLGELFQYNDGLAKFDAVFTKAGWDDQGVRWTREADDEPEDVFIVEFTNKNHTKWRIT